MWVFFSFIPLENLKIVEFFQSIERFVYKILRWVASKFPVRIYPDFLDCSRSLNENVYNNETWWFHPATLTSLVHSIQSILREKWEFGELPSHVGSVCVWRLFFFFLYVKHIKNYGKIGQLPGACFPALSVTLWLKPWAKFEYFSIFNNFNISIIQHCMSDWSGWQTISCLFAMYGEFLELLSKMHRSVRLNNFELGVALPHVFLDA